jgi:hypothetical protein
MSTGTAVAEQTEAASQSDFDEHTDLFRRFIQAGIDDVSRLPKVPDDAVFFLVPDDDGAFAERVIAMAAATARRGRNVYLHHVRLADLPELIEPEYELGTAPGTRRATYEPETGEVLTNQVLGADGEWRDSEEPFPIPRDDESDPSFRF